MLYDSPLARGPARLEAASIRYFISLAGADQIFIVDEAGQVLVDERDGTGGADSLPASDIDPPRFRFPRNEFVWRQGAAGRPHLYLVTGTAVPAPEGRRGLLYLVTNIDKTMADAMWESTGASNAFFVGTVQRAHELRHPPHTSASCPGNRKVHFQTPA